MRKVKQSVLPVLMVIAILVMGLIVIKKVLPISGKESHVKGASNVVTAITPAAPPSSGKYPPGTKIPLYLDLSTGILDNPLQGSYIVIKLPKDKFGSAKSSDVANMGSIKNVQFSQTADEYQFVINLNDISSGTSMSIPFDVTPLSDSYSIYDFISVEQNLYDKSGSVLSSSNIELPVITKLPVLTGGTATSGYRTAYIEESDLDPVKPGYISEDFVYGLPVTINYQTSGSGRDSRESQVTVKLPPGVVMDESAVAKGWVFNSETNEATLLTNAPVNATLGNFTLNVKFKDIKVDELLVFERNVRMVNDDGTVEEIHHQDQYAVKFKVYKENPRYTLSYSLADFVFDNNEDLKTIPTLETLTIYLYDSESSPTKAMPVSSIRQGYKFQKKIAEVELIHTDLAAEVTKIEKNQLYGIKKVGTEETRVLLAENVKLKTKTAINSPEYFDAIEFVFPEPFQVQNTYGTGSSKDRLAFTSSGVVDESTLTAVGQELAVVSPYLLKSNPASMKYGDNLEASTTSNKQFMNAQAGISCFYQNVSPVNATLGQYVYLDGQFKITKSVLKERYFDQFKLVLLVPDGLKLKDLTVSGTGTSKLKFDVTQAEYHANYKNTNKVAIMVPPTTDVDIKALGVNLVVHASFTIDNYLQPGANSIEGYLSWGNTDSQGETYISGDTIDEFDLNDNLLTTDKITKFSGAFAFIEPKEVVITKGIKRETDSGYLSGTIPVDKTDDLNYKLTIINYSDFDKSGGALIDVLPYKGDTNLVANNGNYTSRNSTFSIKLKEAIQPKTGFTVYYSMDVPGKGIAENNEKNWLTESQVTDFSEVTMLQIKVNPGNFIKAKTETSFEFKARFSADTLTTSAEKATNTVGLYFNNDYVLGVEGSGATAEIVNYSVKGNIYFDKNKNSIKNSGEKGESAYTVFINKVNNDGSLELIDTVTTNKDGDYLSKKITDRGNYLIKVDLQDGDTVSNFVASTASVLGTDVNAAGEATFSVSPQQKEKIINVGLSTVSPKFFDIYTQQVILSENPGLVVPTTGLMTLKNQMDSGGTTDFNLLVKSKVNDFNEYQKTSVKTTSDPIYRLETVIPEYYRYVGQVVTTEEKEHQQTNKILDSVILDSNQSKEYWVTVYLEPTVPQTASPRFYGWNYGQNKSNSVTE